MCQPEVIGRFLVTAFFAVVFLQSALDKLTDTAGNLEFLARALQEQPVPAGDGDADVLGPDGDGSDRRHCCAGWACCSSASPAPA